MKIKKYKKIKNNMDKFLNDISHVQAMANILQLLIEDEPNAKHVDIFSLSIILAQHLKIIRHNICDIRKDLFGL